LSQTHLLHGVAFPFHLNHERMKFSKKTTLAFVEQDVAERIWYVNSGFCHTLHPGEAGHIHRCDQPSLSDSRGSCWSSLSFRQVKTKAIGFNISSAFIRLVGTILLFKFRIIVYFVCIIFQGDLASLVAWKVMLGKLWCINDQ
jgi:hypothetical protein